MEVKREEKIREANMVSLREAKQMEVKWNAREDGK